MAKRKTREEAFIRGGWTDYDISYLIEDLLEGEDTGEIKDAVTDIDYSKGANAGLIIKMNSGQKFKVIVKEVG